MCRPPWAAATAQKTLLLYFHSQGGTRQEDNDVLVRPGPSADCCVVTGHRGTVVA